MSGRNLESVAIKELTVDTVGPTARHHELGELTVPVHLSLTAIANVPAKEVSSAAVAASLGDWLALNTKATASGFGKDGFTARTTLHLDAGRAARLITPQMEQKFGKIQIAGTCDVTLDAGGKLGTPEAPGDVNAAVALKTRFEHVGYPKQQTTIGALTTDIGINSGYLLTGETRPTALRFGVSLRDVAAMGMATVGSADLDVKAEAPAVQIRQREGELALSYPKGRLADARIELRVKAAKYHDKKKKLETQPTDVTLGVAARAELRDTRLGRQPPETAADPLSQFTRQLSIQHPEAQMGAARGLMLQVGNFLSLGLDAQYTPASKTFEVALEQALLLAPALEQVPAKFLEKAPKVETNAQQGLQLKMEGRVPTQEQIRALQAPVELDLSVTLNGDVALPEMGVSADRIEQALSLKMKGIDDVRLKERISVAKVKHKDALGDDYLQPLVALSLGLERLDLVSLGLNATLPRHATEVDVEAQVSGLGPMAKRRIADALGKPEPDGENDTTARAGVDADKATAAMVRGVVEQISASFKLKARAQDLSTLAMVKGLDVQGGVKADVTAGLSAGRAGREASGQLAFSAQQLGVTLSKSKGNTTEVVADVKGMDADIRLGRRYDLIFGSAEGGTGRQATYEPLSGSFLGKIKRLLALRGRKTSRSLYGDLRTYSSRRDSLNIDSVTAGPAKVEDFSLDLNFEDGVWIDHLSMTVLGGSVNGRVGAGLLDGNYVVAVDFEFTGLNGKSMLPFLDERVSDEDAEISGNFMLAMGLGGQEQVGLDDLRMSLNITKVGSRALDRFLLAQDPKESNAGIVNARKYTRLGRPHRVSIGVVNGQMRQKASVKIAHGPVIDLPLPESIPLNRIMSLEIFDGPLRALNQVRDLLQKLSATKITFDEKGKIGFAR